MDCEDADDEKQMRLSQSSLEMDYAYFLYSLTGTR